MRDGLLDEWIERWRTQIVPLRRALGFDIGGVWIDRERNRFIWLQPWPVSWRPPSVWQSSYGRAWCAYPPWWNGARTSPTC